MSNLRISIIQTTLHWENKPANLDMLEKKISDIPIKTELIVLPEMFSTGFSMNNQLLAETMDGKTVNWMRKIAADKGVIITGSFIAKDGTGEETRYYNRLIWMLPNGDFSFYDKRHLFAYGKEDQHYCAGEKRVIASVNGWKINLQICYDLRFPVWLRQSLATDGRGVAEYDLIIVVANWPSARSLAWKTLLQARAIENQCFVIGVNRTGTDGRGMEYSGESLVAGPSGEIIKLMGSEDAIFSHTLDRGSLEQFRLKYPFLHDADRFFIQP